VADLTVGRRSAEGHEFFVEKHIAEVSKTISAMLSGTFAESSSGEIRFPEITTPVLEKVIQYMHYKRRYENSDKQFPEFAIERNLVSELLLAANFLDC